MSEIPEGGSAGVSKGDPNTPTEDQTLSSHYGMPPTSETQAAKKQRPKSALIAGAVVVGLIAAGMGGWLVYNRFFASTAIEQAFEACEGAKPLERILAEAGEEEAGQDVDPEIAEYLDGVLTVEDSGRTLIVSTKPKDEDPLSIGSLAFSCVADSLEAPTWVTESVSTTRALDGRQNAEWGNFSAQWGYHPDSGLNLILTEN